MANSVCMWPSMVNLVLSVMRKHMWPSMANPVFLYVTFHGKFSVYAQVSTVIVSYNQWLSGMKSTDMKCATLSNDKSNSVIALFLEKHAKQSMLMHNYIVPFARAQFLVESYFVSSSCHHDTSNTDKNQRSREEHMLSDTDQEVLSVFKFTFDLIKFCFELTLISDPDLMTSYVTIREFQLCDVKHFWPKQKVHHLRPVVFQWLFNWSSTLANSDTSSYEMTQILDRSICHNQKVSVVMTTKRIKWPPKNCAVKQDLQKSEFFQWLFKWPLTLSNSDISSYVII